MKTLMVVASVRNGEIVLSVLDARKTHRFVLDEAQAAAAVRELADALAKKLKKTA